MSKISKPCLAKMSEKAVQTKLLDPEKLDIWSHRCKTLLTASLATNKVIAISFCVVDTFDRCPDALKHSFTSSVERPWNDDNLGRCLPKKQHTAPEQARLLSNTSQNSSRGMLFTVLMGLSLLPVNFGPKYPHTRGSTP